MENITLYNSETMLSIKGPLRIERDSSSRVRVHFLMLGLHAVDKTEEEARKHLRVMFDAWCEYMGRRDIGLARYKLAEAESNWHYAEDYRRKGGPSIG